MARVSIFLIAVALIAGMAGCGGGGVEYDLTISSIEGGEVTSPGEGTFTYDEGEVVNLVVTTDDGYRFVNWTGDVSTVAGVSAATTTITMNGDYSITASFGLEYTPMVAAGGWHTVGLRSDGRVVAVGMNMGGECNVTGWEDIIQVAAGWLHTVGLRSDGTVVAVGMNVVGECNVTGWEDIIQVAAGTLLTVGLRDDGTVVAVGHDYYGQCDVANWTDIVQVAAGYYRTLGLRSDGTVVGIGKSFWGQWEIGGWTDITQVATGYVHTVGLKSDAVGARARRLSPYNHNRLIELNMYWLYPDNLQTPFLVAHP